MGGAVVFLQLFDALTGRIRGEDHLIEPATLRGPENCLTPGSPVILSERPSAGHAAAAMCGDMDAVHALWQEHRRWVAAVILAHKPQSADLEDLLQEVAMTLVAKVNTLRDQGNIRAWLRVVAVNAARAAGRTERSRPRLRLAGSEVNEPAMQQCDDPLELDDHAKRVMRLAAQLPETYREPLLLKAVHGLRTRQIAEIMDLPEATVDTRVSRARRMLRELLQNEEITQPVSHQKLIPPMSAVTQDVAG